MKKSSKKLDYNYILIILFCSILVYLFLPETATFGCKTDWISQHIVFPDYFRKLFYATGNLFPNFALSIGAGQNIYNFSYYGLLSPFVILSYLFPMIKMKTYVIGLNIILFNVLGIILYYFFKGKTTKKIALITTFLLLMAAPILLHFHKHFMFVNYLPFLILGLIGVDKFFQNDNKTLIAFSTFMIIMTSYYYSIPSILVLCIYALYKYLETNNKIVIKEMVKKGLLFCIPIIIGIVSSAILLLPTFFAIQSGRSPVEKINYLERLIPIFNLEGILYGDYAIGLTFIALLSLVYGLVSKKKEQKFLAIILIIILTFPIIIYTLNGNLYFRNKVLIPFIPLFGLFLINFLPSLLERKIEYKKIVFVTIIILFLCIIFQFKYLAIYLDAIILLGIIYIYYQKLTNKTFFILILFAAPLMNLFIANGPRTYINEKESNRVDKKEVAESIINVLNKETQIVRFNNLEDTLAGVNHIYHIDYNQNSVYSSVYNSLYKRFYEKTFKNALPYRNSLVLPQNNDILFQTFMGVKYLYTEKEEPVGYHKIGKNLYQNNNVLPMFYGTSKITNERDFDQLEYPNTIAKLLSSVVVKEKESSETKDIPIRKLKLDYEIGKQKNLKIQEKDQYIKVTAKKNNSLLELKTKNISSNIVIINISLKERSDCTKGDLSIEINDVNNVLTCKQWLYKNDNKTFHYVISKKENIDTLKIKFTKGTYKIKKIEVYELDYNKLGNVKEDQSEFIVNKNNSRGDKIIGSIDMKENGYFVTSIPYDEGFKIKVDGEYAKKEIVNKAFLGFQLKKGMHTIELIYEAPLQKEGIFLSLIGIISFLILLLLERRDKYGRYKEIL